MARVAVINSEGLGISGSVKKVLMNTHEYELFGEVPDSIKGDGLYVDLYTLLEEFGARDENGTTMATPCPSRLKEWANAVDVAMRDLNKRGCGKPAKIWIPGALRPLVCKKDEEGTHYFACGCERCTTDEELDFVANFIYEISEKGSTGSDQFLGSSETFQKMMKKRSTQFEKFDETLKQKVMKYFPKADVSFYVDIKTPYLPSTYNLNRDDYTLYPCMMGPDHRGEMLLKERDDFQLAAVLNDGRKPMLLRLPGEASEDDYSEYSDELRDFASRMFGERADLRCVAERFLNTVCTEVSA
ncbi:MAG: hypothetical protein KKH41_01575 [Candidatus Thermoplasmatota archaeon]|nr:hypothetical protein [Euryarchaeota archaeon]MBU4031864.1 hypothetical protein [Candidatus Thermoplasmatota archaeon]MBU4070690.1 hypothetical protein [Candidatus Thermoplasmatota archaeon]MBU4145266.1 hypothetical protein [Candidatus Thermoplasmatota archaeon]MBU4591252.1 hypothetical protein [Candidatus Thermoplasmatota archaeon]